jgi:hypothetical protein
MEYIITLPPAVREDALPVSSPSPMRRHLRENVIVAVVVLFSCYYAPILAVNLI